MVGVEPTCCEAHEPESCVSANSTTSAKITLPLILRQDGRTGHRIFNKPTFVVYIFFRFCIGPGGLVHPLDFSLAPFFDQGLFLLDQLEYVLFAFLNAWLVKRINVPEDCRIICRIL